MSILSIAVTGRKYCGNIQVTRDFLLLNLEGGGVVGEDRMRKFALQLV
jgi:hypothetical protein